MIIAIDGPAGSGKGALSKEIEKRLHFTRIDTGAMYRCLTLKILRNKIELDDMIKIEEILNNTKIEFKRDDGEVKVMLDDKDVTQDIRRPEVNDEVSQVSAIKIIRIKMVELQRKMKDISENIVMEGRDITTVVFPDAEIKIYLTADIHERARRRYNEMRNENVTFENVLESMITRDENDKTKEMGALKIAEDAKVIDNTNLSIEETFHIVEEMVKEKING